MKARLYPFIDDKQSDISQKSTLPNAALLQPEKLGKELKIWKINDEEFWSLEIPTGTDEVKKDGIKRITKLAIEEVISRLLTRAVGKGALPTPNTFNPISLINEKMIFAAKLRLGELGPNNGVTIPINQLGNEDEIIGVLIINFLEKNGDTKFEEKVFEFRQTPIKRKEKL